MNVAIITESFIVYLLSSHFDMILSTDHIFHFDMIYLVLRLKTKPQLYYDYFKILNFRSCHIQATYNKKCKPLIANVIIILSKKQDCLKCVQLKYNNEWI